jgi:hypothetical protein
MATQHYRENIQNISKWFGVSEICSKYLYHRAMRSKRKDVTHLDWSVKLQNALVRADRCLGIDWERMFFGKEEDVLATHGIVLDEMPDTVFRWDVPESENKNTGDVDNGTDNLDGWTTIKKTKKPKKKNLAFEFVLSGIYV